MDGWMDGLWLVSQCSITNAAHACRRVNPVQLPPTPTPRLLSPQLLLLLLLMLAP